MESVESSEVDGVFALMARVERLYRVGVSRRLEDLELSLRDHQVLTLLEGSRETTPGGLARACGVSRQFLHRRLEALERDGLLQRWRVRPEDSEVRVGLTPAGEEVVLECRERVGAVSEGVANRFGVQRLAALNDLLRSLERALEAPRRGHRARGDEAGPEALGADGGRSEASSDGGLAEDAAPAAGATCERDSAERPALPGAVRRVERPRADDVDAEAELEALRRDLRAAMRGGSESSAEVEADLERFDEVSASRGASPQGPNLA